MDALTSPVDTPFEAPPAPSLPPDPGARRSPTSLTEKGSVKRQYKVLTGFQMTPLCGCFNLQPNRSASPPSPTGSTAGGLGSAG
jgi:hypothetical protein